MATAPVALLRRIDPDRRFALITAGVVVIVGALVVMSPLVVLALVGAAGLIGLTAMPAVPHLVLLVGLTAIVPYGVQNNLGVGGGSGAPGLLISDVLLLSGLLRVVPWLLTRPFPKALRVRAVLIAAFVVVAALQLVHGLVEGRNASTVGAEFRVLLGFAAFLLAVPILCDERQRRSLVRALPWLGLAVGLWGLTQWVFNFQFSEAADAGVQEGIRFTTSGRGQLQGGLFAFPVAALVALAGLMSDGVRTARGRMFLVAVVALNAVCLLLTYERTFWLATTFAAAVIVLRAGSIQRFRAVVAGTAVALLGFTAMATLAPAELTAARERLMSLSQYGEDDSVRYRLTESKHVLDKIEDHPVIGNGLGARIFFGRPWDRVLPESLTFAHNGYLWLAWKLGIPGALLLLVVLFSCLRGARASGGAFDAVRNGARGALLALAVASVTFPSFNQLGITATMGVLMAAAAAPQLGVEETVADAELRLPARS